MIKISELFNEKELSRLAFRTAFPQKFNEWNFLGEIDDYDVALIIGTIP